MITFHEDDHIVYALADLCAKVGTECIVQVGAEDGYECQLIADRLGCRAVAIEGDTTFNASCAWANEYYQCVIGATDGPMPFYHHTSPGLSSHFYRGDNGEELWTVNQRRLDTWCAEHAVSPDTLIIDTEGSTLDVLEGCGEMIERIKLVYAECQSYETRHGIRPLSVVDEFLAFRGFTAHRGLPAYSQGDQGNFCWVRK